MKYILILSTILLSLSANSQHQGHHHKKMPPLAKVVKVIGKVFFEKSQIKVDQVIQKSGIIKTGRNSFVKFFVKETQNYITLGPNSNMKLEWDEKMNNKYSLFDGMCRWTRSGNKSKLKKSVKIHTKTASFGVRGTDFWIKTTALLGESETIIFSGIVEFEGNGDRVLLTKNQWGGIGGRFGSKIGKVLDLPKNVIDHFKSSIEI